MYSEPTIVMSYPFKILLYCLATATGYFIAAKLGVAASVMPDGIALFWPSNAVLLAALLLRPAREWIFLAIAILPSEIFADIPAFSVKQAVLFALVNIFETVSAAGLLRLTAGTSFSFARLRNVALFGLLAIVVAAGSAALLGAGVYMFTADKPEPYWSLWRIWWFGDGLGLLIVTPVIHAWLNNEIRWSGLGLRRSLEMVALFTATVTAGFWIFSRQYAVHGDVIISPFVLLPLTIWAAVQFDVRSVVSVNLVIAAFSVYFTANHAGPFAVTGELDATLNLQQYLAIMAFPSLALAAFVQELNYHNEQTQILYRCIEAIDEGIMFCDARLPGNPIIYANPALERMTGFKLAEMQGRNPGFLQGEDEQEPEITKVRDAVAKGETVRSLLHNYRKDGTLFWNSLTVSPVSNDNGELTHFIGIEHDITALKKSEEELRLAHDQLDQANRELEFRVRDRTRELEEANKRLEKLASTDPLTGAYNRRYFFSRAKDEIQRAVRYARPISLLTLDIDFFKRINDQYGHAVGDNALVELVVSMQAMKRPSDVLARFGGEEFVLLLPETDCDETVNVAERMRKSIAAIKIDSGQGAEISMTVSAGVATLSDAEDSLDNLLKRADQALYRAKAEGRDCLRVAKPFTVE